MGEVSAHECADDGEGIFSPYATATRFQARSARIFLCFLSSHEITHGRGRRHRHPVPTPHAIRYGYTLSISLRSYFSCFLSPPERKDQRKCYCLLRCKNLPQNRESLIKRNGIVTSFALFLLRQLLEILHRLTR